MTFGIPFIVSCLVTIFVIAFFAGRQRRTIKQLTNQLNNLSETIVLLGTIIRIGIPESILTEVIESASLFDDPNCKEALEWIKQKRLQEHILFVEHRARALRVKREKEWEIETAEKLRAGTPMDCVKISAPEKISPPSDRFWG